MLKFAFILVKANSESNSICDSNLENDFIALSFYSFIVFIVSQKKNFIV